MSLVFPAPYCRGRMLPALFSCMPFAKKPRFEGDPWATIPHSPWWYAMHSNACRDAAKGTIYAHALYHDKRVAPALRDRLTPSPQVAGIDRPSVGSMGARQPADAGPSEQRELFAEVTA